VVVMGSTPRWASPMSSGSGPDQPPSVNELFRHRASDETASS